MFVTGRLALLIGIGVVPVALLSAAGGGSAPIAWAVALAWLVGAEGAAVVDALLAADPRRVRVDRELPARVRLGEPVAVRVRVVNTGRRRLAGMLRDGWEPTAGAEPDRAALDVPAGEARDVTIGLRPRRRGERRAAFVAVRSRGPLGLAGRQAVLAQPASVRVLPPFASRRHLPSRLQRLRELDGSTSVLVRGRGTEFDSLREYVRGDDVRSIDWRATARSRTTMLRTWRPERDRHVVIVVDTGRTSAARVGDGTRLDADIEATLLLAALADRAGDHVHVLCVDRVVRARVTGARGAALLPALVDALAGVEPQLIDTDWETATREAARFTTRPSLIVALTAADAAAASRSLLGALPAWTAKARVLVAAATDDEIEVAAQERHTSEDIWLAAAAERTLADARGLARMFVRLGADALTATPERLPPLVADRYLELKARGGL
ncbi:DUF58 domain-containing protein [Microbacterium sp. LRZ72]|uniref:DUF58 domain-containing protein n=1 Tax=Microbacterium sp. LRZ72 TaxID=2942481 RepID=UPI0029A95ED5|nr:DUF58 domain-containing protein [Microbacterium sp. LRZ72]MDX2377048.1 DUF58 domain-containing protein [Microbacterium sp. LRZ72]